VGRDEMPEPWRTALARKGIDSLRGLADKAGISPMAASRLVKGEGTSVETVNAVAWFVFDDDVEYVWALRGLSGVKDQGRFDLPPEAGLLTGDQRAAVVAVVRAMLSQEVKDALAGKKGRPSPPAGRRLDKGSLAELEEYERDRRQAAVRNQQERARANG
jgi:hypothetical protein